MKAEDDNLIGLAKPWISAVRSWALLRFPRALTVPSLLVGFASCAGALPFGGARSLAFGRPNSKRRGSIMNIQPNANSQPSTSTFPIATLPAQPSVAPACCPTRSTPAPPVSSAVYQGRCDDVPGAVRFYLPRRLRVF